MLKTKFRNFTAVISILIFAFMLVSCTTTTSTGKTTKQKAELTKYPEAMLWELKGTDSQGNPSSVSILGTIHVADNRLYPLPAVVESAWKSADRIVGEISTDDWGRYTDEVQKRTIASLSKDKSVKDYLTAEENEFLTALLGAQTYTSLSMFEPWVLNSTLSTILLQSSGLFAEQSYDVSFITKAHSAGIKMEGLDSLDTQLDILQYGTWDEQIAFLKDGIESLQNITEETMQLVSLYEAYLSADPDVFTAIYAEELEEDIKQNPLYKDYYKKMFNDRNKEWADKIADYLKQGGNTFIFAGTGHFTGDNSVFDYMRKNGTLKK